VESDHQDVYPTYTSIRDAFIQYVKKLEPINGELIYCADDPGAREVADAVQCRKTPYGFNAAGDFGITRVSIANETQIFMLRNGEEFTLKTPGKHNVLNATAALALTLSLLQNAGARVDQVQMDALHTALQRFCGSKRRSEILGEHNGILFMDDYGHHPTAIKSTLAGLREFYPKRRIVCSFMSHTYTRTAALLPQFASCWDDADVVFFHKIYASAREKATDFTGVNGRTIYEQTRLQYPQKKCFYIKEPLDAIDSARAELRSGDIFITMGAGDNWKLGQALYNGVVQ
jgi:UDP-N-acetylmuramate--alanine ligase